MSVEEVFMRLCTSFVVGTAIGYEREARRKVAGLKTHTLVCVGSCLIMMISTSMGTFDNTDSSRIAAQIVSGIGFLGAGTILREGTSVTGLTTAANLWVVSAVGMAIGRGIFAEAFITVGLVLVALLFFPELEKWRHSQEETYLIINSLDKIGQTGKIGTLLGELGVNIKAISIEENENKTLNFHLHLDINETVSGEIISAGLQNIDGVLSIEKK